MLNQVIMVGRIVGDPEIRVSEDGKKYSYLTLAVGRSYKNADGIYETDFIDCVLWNGIASSTVEYCKKGDVVGVKGRIQTSNYELENGETKRKTQVVAEKVTFLSTSKEKIEENENTDEMEM